MAEEPDDLAKAAILEWLSIQYTIKPDYWFLPQEFHIALKRELEKYGYNTPEKITGLVKIMADSGQLKSSEFTYQISNKGRKDLETIYNDEWVVSQINAFASKKEKVKQEKKEQFDLDERRHQELVKASREGNKIQKYGVWVAMILGATALLIAIFKP